MALSLRCLVFLSSPSFSLFLIMSPDISISLSNFYLLFTLFICLVVCLIVCVSLYPCLSVTIFVAFSVLPSVCLSVARNGIEEWNNLVRPFRLQVTFLFISQFWRWYDNVVLVVGQFPVLFFPFIFAFSKELTNVANLHLVMKMLFAKTKHRLAMRTESLQEVNTVVHVTLDMLAMGLTVTVCITIWEMSHEP